MKAFVVALILSVGMSLVAVPAAAQSSIVADLGMAEDGTHGGVTLLAPFSGDHVDVYAHISSVSAGMDMDRTHQTHAGFRFKTPRFGPVEAFANVGVNHVAGPIGLEDMLAVGVQPGARYYVRPTWGLEGRLPKFNVAEVVERMNPYDRHTLVYLGLFVSY